MGAHWRKTPVLSHNFGQGGHSNGLHSSCSPSFSFVLNPFAHLYLIHALPLCLSVPCNALHSLTIQNLYPRPFPSVSLSPVCFSFVPYISLCLSLSLRCRCLTVTWLLFYFNLTLLFRNRHPHALAILLAPFHSLFTWFFLSSSWLLPCSNVYFQLSFSVF